MHYSNPLEWQKALLEQEGYDALISSSPDNLAYTIGYTIPSQQLGLRKRRFFAVVTPGGMDVLLVVTPEMKQAQAFARIQDVRDYNEFTELPVKILAEILRELGVDRGRVGLEMDFLPINDYLALTHELPHTNFEKAEVLFDRLRMLKTQEELDILSDIGRIVHHAHIEACEVARPGWSEIQYGNAIRESVLAQGGEGLNNLVIGSGYRSTWSNCPPTDKILEPGEVIKVDVFAHINGYQSDIARTVVVGGPTPFQQDVWQRIVEIHSAVLEKIKPGVHTAEIWRHYIEKFTEYDLVPALKFAGHGLGLTLHEEPYISPYSNIILEEQMFLAVEEVTHIRENGFHIEDELIVTANGCELVSDGRGVLMVIQ